VDGESLLKAMGDEEQQRQVLGEDYDWVTGTIAGSCTPPAEETSGESSKRPLEDGVTEAAKRARLS
jgi:hypothetical protein